MQHDEEVSANPAAQALSDAQRPKMAMEKALAIARDKWQVLKPFVDRCDIAGSIRRMKPKVKDIELLAIPTLRPFTETVGDMFGTTERTTMQRLPGFKETVLGMGTLVKGKDVKRYVQLELPEGIALDLFLATPENWGFQLAMRTGSEGFSKLLALRWVKMGYHGVDGMLTKNGKPIPLPNEEDLFALLRMRCPDPAHREVTKDGLKPWVLW